MDDRWLNRPASERGANVELDLQDGICPSMYSFHSSPEEKGKLLYSLAECGIEVNVNRTDKKDRIREWIQSGVIEEEDEQEGEATTMAADVAEGTAPGDEEERQMERVAMGQAAAAKSTAHIAGLSNSTGGRSTSH